MNRDERITKANKGFSLVELIIAVAILVIVIGSVCSFIVISSRNYANGNNDISVQQEAQLALNQMSDVIIDATRSINYVGYDSALQPFKALKDAEFAFTPENKALIVYNVETTAGDGTPSPSPTPSPTAGGLQNYMFYWQKSTEDLYFAVQGADGSFPFPGAADCVLLAEHVTDFRVDLSEVEAKRVVKLCIVFEVGNKKCEIANNITVRNKVLINDAEIAPLDKSKKISVKAKEPSVILEPGEEFHFSTPKVTGMNITDKSVKWSIVGTVATGTTFKDEANGILQIAGDETCDEFEVKITTNDKNSDNVQATDTVKVYVKRVTKVELYKQSDDFDGDEEDRPGPLEVEQGATFVIGANVEGVKLLSPCSGCAVEYATDKDVTDFKVLEGSGYVTMDASSVTSSQPTFTLHEDTPVGTTITIQAASVLSIRHVSTYGVVYGEITLTVVEKTNKVQPYDGILKHGISTRVDDKLINGFITEVSNHVLVVHVVDNATKQMIYEVVCRDDGWNMWISPDMFDLDLKKSYTFYLQAISSVSIKDYKEWQENGGKATGGAVRVSSKEEIWTEYKENKQTKAPYGYTGTKYQCSEVYGTVLEPVEFTYSYKSKLYCGEEFTLDTFNIVKADIGNNQVNILQDVWFDRSNGRNIDANSLDTGVKYSVYKEDENTADAWEELYVYKEDENGYEGASSLYDGNLVIEENAGMRALKLKTGQIQKTSGTYHIVPGFVYNAKDHVENKPKYILGPENFTFPCDTAEPHYYRFDESTYHITVTAEGTMDMNTSAFTGSVCFPLPKEMKEQTYFTNMDKTDWQEANLGTSGLSLQAIDANGDLVWITFDRIRYRKIENENAYEVEPIKVTKLHQNDDLYLEVTYSYGTSKCAATGTKWNCITAAGNTTTNATFSFKQDDKTYRAYLPLPTDKNFMFEEGKTERQPGKCWFFGFGQDEHGKILETDKMLFGTDTVYCDYDSAEGVYTLTFVESVSAMPAGGAPVRTVLNIKGQYQWQTGQSGWSYKKGQGQIIESNANLVTTYNGQSIETYLAPPTDTTFWTDGWNATESSKSTLSGKTLYYFIHPLESGDTNLKECQNCTISYWKSSDVFYIEIKQNSADLGCFKWNDSSKQWEKQNF